MASLQLKIQEFKIIYFTYRAAIYSYLNIGFSFFELIALYFSKPTAWWFTCVLFLRFIMSGVLFFGRKHKHARVCQAWCLYEACMIVLIMTLALSQLVKLSEFGIVVVFLSFVFKMYGLWVVYYLSLEVQNDISVYFLQNAQVQDTTAPTSSNRGIMEEDRASNLLERSQNFQNLEKENAVDDDSPVQYSVIYM